MKKSERHRKVISNSADVAVIYREETDALTPICTAKRCGQERRILCKQTIPSQTKMWTGNCNFWSKTFGL